MSDLRKGNFGDNLRTKDKRLGLRKTERKKMKKTNMRQLFQGVLLQKGVKK